MACAFAGAGAAVAWPLLRPTAYPTLAQRYPEREAAFLRANGLEGNLFNEFRVGGYLEWVLPASSKVFLDGRYGPFNKVGMEYYEAHRTVESFRALLDRYPVEMAIYGYPGGQIRPDPKGPPRGPSALLFPREQWALVYMGGYGMVFLRRIPRFQKAVGAMEYGLLRPDDLPDLLWRAERGAVPRDALAGDLRRALKGEAPPWIRPALSSALERLAAAGPPDG